MRMREVVLGILLEEEVSPLRGIARDTARSGDRNSECLRD